MMFIAYKPQGNDADDVHRDMTAPAKNDIVKRDKWLRRTEAKQRIGIRLDVKI
jgi:hypothetical protein